MATFIEPVVRLVRRHLSAAAEHNPAPTTTTFIEPVVRFVRQRSSAAAEHNAASGESDNKTSDSTHAATIKHVQIETERIAKASTIMLVTYVFGILVPPLLLLLPISSWFNLCALRYNKEHGGKRSFGETVACHLMVHTPITTVLLFAHVGNAVVVLSIFMDFQFALGPIILYTTLYVAGIARMRRVRHYWSKNLTFCTELNTTKLDPTKQTVIDFSR